MTRRELIQAVQQAVRERVQLSQGDVAAVIDATFEQIAAALREQGRFVHPGFGAFTVKRRAARPGFNPRTGEAITIGEAPVIRFAPSRGLSETL
ncbi:MAG: HU family DNA-binding protein [Myxococcales bacterium]|nr:HU family DNA-binding protein [Myxococcales bacterium]